jgi:hypothetical protein
VNGFLGVGNDFLAVVDDFLGVGNRFGAVGSGFLGVGTRALPVGSRFLAPGNDFLAVAGRKGRKGTGQKFFFLDSLGRFATMGVVQKYGKAAEGRKGKEEMAQTVY